MISLILSRHYGREYMAKCPECGNEYLFKTAHYPGAADFVDVICDFCSLELGRVREDMGGDKRLSRKDLIHAG